MKRYLFFAQLTYTYSILRPLEKEIWKRGDEVAWYLEPSCADMLLPEERRLATIEEVMEWNPVAVFSPGNYVYDFFPGVKVAVFHGYPMRKRIEKVDDHFTLRGWYDIYCTQGPSSTPYFTMLSEKKKYFKIYETGWCKVDAFFDNDLCEEEERVRPTVLYSPTFTKSITSAYKLLPVIDRIAANRPWNWIITFHPKLNDPQLIAGYQRLAEKHPNVNFAKVNKGLETFRQSDIMLCDSSSIVVEYLMLDKPVVTFRNTHPGKHLLNVIKEEDVEPALEQALLRPTGLMEHIHAYTAYHEAHCDGNNSARVLDAVDDFIANHKGRIKRKPLNLFRKLRLRKRLKRWYPITKG